MDGWMHGWMDAWVNGWMRGGWLDKLKNKLVHEEMFFFITSALYIID